MAPQAHHMAFQPAPVKPLCSECRRIVHTGQEVPDGCRRCFSQRGIWRCLKCPRWSRSRLDTFWGSPCQKNDPLCRIPNQSGQQVMGGDSDRSSDLDNEIAQQAAQAHRERTGVENRSHRNIVTCGIEGLDPRNLHTSPAQAAANDDRTGAATATRTITFEAIDANGNTYMQEMDEPIGASVAKANSRAISPVFPLGPKPDVRTAPPAVGLDGAPNPSKGKAAAIAKEHRFLQRQLVGELKAKLKDRCYAAAHCSGTAPVCLQNNAVEAVLVEPGHMWASIHQTHDMHRCDLTVYCRKCGSASSSYNTKVLRVTCDPASSATDYHQQLIKNMNAGICP